MAVREALLASLVVSSAGADVVDARPTHGNNRHAGNYPETISH
jgi:hypothetical protein